MAGRDCRAVAEHCVQQVAVTANVNIIRAGPNTSVNHSDGHFSLNKWSDTSSPG